MVHSLIIRKREKSWLIFSPLKLFSVLITLVNQIKYTIHIIMAVFSISLIIIWFILNWLHLDVRLGDES